MQIISNKPLLNNQGKNMMLLLLGGCISNVKLVVKYLNNNSIQLYSKIRFGKSLVISLLSKTRFINLKKKRKCPVPFKRRMVNKQFSG